MLSKNIAFDKSDPFSIVSVEKGQWQITLHLKSSQKKSRCPLCRTYSRSIHSHYHRTIKDLPAFCNQIQLHLGVRRFYCHNKKCKRWVFTERFKVHFTPYGRVSKRLEETLLKLTLLLGGNPGEKLCQTLNITRSSSSLIRLVHRQKLPSRGEVVYVGIDDWAQKKRLSYGSCIVDMERHKLVELLRDREAATVEKWLKKHPEVRVVSRDRFLHYRKGIGEGAPQAQQVGDRWHLLKNLGDALQKLLERNRQYLKYSLPQKKRLPALPVPKSASANSIHRRWQLEQIRRLHQEGLGLKAIAGKLQMARVTVRKYLTLSEPPLRGGGRLQVNIALFERYVRDRIREEPHVQLLQLFKEIKALGYNGGRSVAYNHLHALVDGRLYPLQNNGSYLDFLPSRVRMLLVKKTADLSGREQKIVTRLSLQCPQIGLAYTMAIQFREMMAAKQAMNLKNWIHRVLKSEIPELISFAKGILNDFEATKNALTLPWSNGQVEGQINKLKTIKRQMYGRASFELLRKRLLLDTS